MQLTKFGKIGHCLRNFYFFLENTKFRNPSIENPIGAPNKLILKSDWFLEITITSIDGATVESGRGFIEEIQQTL